MSSTGMDLHSSNIWKYHLSVVWPCHFWRHFFNGNGGSGDGVSWAGQWVFGCL